MRIGVSHKDLSGSKLYKYVRFVMDARGTYHYQAKCSGGTKLCATEREAAIAVDIILINKGKNPVNILIHKSMIIKLPRNYGSFTDKAFCTTNGLWVPKKFALNWNKGTPPLIVECDLPDWFVKKNEVWTTGEA